MNLVRRISARPRHSGLHRGADVLGLRRLRLRTLALGILALGALSRPTLASANPGLEGTRNLALGGATRASATGASAYFVNPAAMNMSRTIEVQTNYQAALERNTHGFGIAAVDSMNSRRVALGLGYSTMLGLPKVGFSEIDADGPRELRLNHRAQEVGLALSVIVIKRWLVIGVKPKYQNSSLRFLDSDDTRQDARPTHHAFGVDVGASMSILGWVNLAVVGYNLSGPQEPAHTEETGLDLEPYDVVDGSFDPKYLPRISAYPRGFGHGAAVFPFRTLQLSVNFDGAYDVTSYAADKFIRKTYGGGGEYQLGRLLLRLGGGWDSRGRGSDDDRGYISAGLGVLKAAEQGKVGVIATVGFRRDLSGILPETYLGANLGLRFNPGF